MSAPAPEGALDGLQAARAASTATLREGLDMVAAQQIKVEKQGSTDKLEDELEVGLLVSNHVAYDVK